MVNRLLLLQGVLGVPFIVPIAGYHMLGSDAGAHRAIPPKDSYDCLSLVSTSIVIAPVLQEAADYHQVLREALRIHTSCHRVNPAQVMRGQSLAQAEIPIALLSSL